MPVIDQDYPGTPIQAGNPNPNGQALDSSYVEGMISKAVMQALELDRQNRKRGRQDTGTGSVTIGRILKHERGLLDQTQTDLARMADIHPTTIGKIESGERGMSLQTFARLSQHLGEGFVWAILDEVASWPSS